MPCRSPDSSRTRELRRALLQERGASFRRVRRAIGEDLRSVLDRQSVFEAGGVDGHPVELLGHPNSERVNLESPRSAVLFAT